MKDGKTQWVMANWPRVAGLPLPDEEWMLRDVPITRSTLECLKLNSLVDPVDRNHARPATRTARATRQMTYRTAAQNSVFGRIDEYAGVSRDTAETFAARPSADVYVVEVFADRRATVADDVKRVREELGLDVQLVGVGTTEPAGYPGRFVEASRDDLLDASSVVLRAVPDAPDALVVHPRFTFHEAARAVLDRTDARRTVMNPGSGDMDDVLRSFLLDDDADEVSRSAHRERPVDAGQRALSDFDPGAFSDDGAVQTSFDVLF